MQLHNLRLPSGAKKNKKRVGRGVGSGRGKTSGRGMGGQTKRSNPGIRIYFEGGQMPLIRRIPKRGFNNKKFAQKYQIVNISDLKRIQGEKITPEILKKEGLISSLNKAVKILGRGEVKRKFEISVQACSKSAKEKIESSGGKVIILER